MCSNFGQIGQLTTELAALEFQNDGCLYFLSFVSDLIPFILACGNEDLNKSLGAFAFRSDSIFDKGIKLPSLSVQNENRLLMRKWSLRAHLLIFDNIIIKSLLQEDDIFSKY